MTRRAVLALAAVSLSATGYGQPAGGIGPRWTMASTGVTARLRGLSAPSARVIWVAVARGGRTAWAAGEKGSVGSIRF